MLFKDCIKTLNEMLRDVNVVNFHKWVCFNAFRKDKPTLNICLHGKTLIYLRKLLIIYIKNIVMIILQTTLKLAKNHFGVNFSIRICRTSCGRVKLFMHRNMCIASINKLLLTIWLLTVDSCLNIKLKMSCNCTVFKRVTINYLFYMHLALWCVRRCQSFSCMLQNV